MYLPIDYVKENEREGIYFIKRPMQRIVYLHFRYLYVQMCMYLRALKQRVASVL